MHTIKLYLVKKLMSQVSLKIKKIEEKPSLRVYLENEYLLIFTKSATFQQKSSLNDVENKKVSILVLKEYFFLN